MTVYCKDEQGAWYPLLQTFVDLNVLFILSALLAVYPAWVLGVIQPGEDHITEVRADALPAEGSAGCEQRGELH